MDPMMLVIMAFFLVVIILTGGFVLLIPLSRQFARYLDARMHDKLGGDSAAEIRQIRASLAQLEQKVSGVVDRQEFLEKVLEARDEAPKLPHG